MGRAPQSCGGDEEAVGATDTEAADSPARSPARRRQGCGTPARRGRQPDRVRPRQAAGGNLCRGIRRPDRLRAALRGVRQSVRHRFHLRDLLASVGSVAGRHGSRARRHRDARRRTANPSAARQRRAGLAGHVGRGSRGSALRPLHRRGRCGTGRHGGARRARGGRADPRYRSSMLYAPSAARRPRRISTSCTTCSRRSCRKTPARTAEVHLLASTYGWSLREILEPDRKRRRAFAAAIERDRGAHAGGF